MASSVPVAGSAYTYAYATLGEIVTWIIGWDLILDYSLGATTVAIGWSGGRRFGRVPDAGATGRQLDPPSGMAGDRACDLFRLWQVAQPGGVVLIASCL
jgi:amino acid transporter